MKTREIKELNNQEILERMEALEKEIMADMVELREMLG